MLEFHMALWAPSLHIFRFSHLQTSTLSVLVAHRLTLLSHITVPACLFDRSQRMSGHHPKPFASRLCLHPTCYFCPAAPSCQLPITLQSYIFPPGSPAPTSPDMHLSGLLQGCHEGPSLGCCGHLHLPGNLPLPQHSSAVH